VRPRRITVKYYAKFRDIGSHSKANNSMESGRREVLETQMITYYGSCQKLTGIQNEEE